MAEIGNIPKLMIEHLTPHVGIKTVSKGVHPNVPIGVFDSGVGGLSVLSEVMKELPHEDVIYLADTARVPFGGRPHDEIMKINREILDFFVKQGVKMVIIACGTSSAIAYPILKEEYKIPMVSMIEPGVRAALAATNNKRIGVIATQNTVDSAAFQNAILTHDDTVRVIAEACPLFVPLIEGGFIEAEETKAVAREYLDPLIKMDVDTLILGCTHYPHLTNVLSGIIKAELINPAVEVVNEVRDILARLHMLKKSSAKANHTYYTTADPLRFEELGSKLLGRPITGVKQIEL